MAGYYELNDYERIAVLFYALESCVVSEMERQLQVSDKPMPADGLEEDIATMRHWFLAGIGESDVAFLTQYYGSTHTTKGILDFLGIALDDALASGMMLSDPHVLFEAPHPSPTSLPQMSVEDVEKTLFTIFYNSLMLMKTTFTTEVLRLTPKQDEIQDAADRMISKTLVDILGKEFLETISTSLLKETVSSIPPYRYYLSQKFDQATKQNSK